MTDSKDLKVLEIDPDLWFRGQRDSALLREDGRMCCLGFLALECGAKKDVILEAAMPSDTVFGDGSEPRWPAELLEGYEEAPGFRDSRLCKCIADLNDDATINDDTRVEALKPLFERLGYRLEVKSPARVEPLPSTVKP